MFDPAGTVPDGVAHTVEVPVDCKNIPREPVALVVSRSAPLRDNLEMVVVARLEVPVTAKDPVVVAFVKKEESELKSEV